MDYISSGITIVNELREDKVSTVLAYDVAFAIMKKKREENKNYA